MTEAEFHTPPPEIPRDRWSRPLVIPPDGGRPVPYTRCTTFVGALEDTYNLGLWQQRMVAAGLATRKDLLLRAASLGTPPAKTDQSADRWKAQMNDVTKAAVEAAAGSAAATTGTALHTLTERLDRGQILGQVPDEYVPHLAAYEDATKDLEAVHIEQFTVLDEYRIGGTPDRILRVPGETGLIVADLKTGGIEYGTGKIAMQLAVYAHSVIYQADGSRTPIDGLRTDAGIIIHLDATTGDCTLHWINLQRAWTEGIPLAHQVREWRRWSARDFLSTYPRPALPDPHQQAALAALDHAINTAPSVDDLTQLWITATQAGVWTDEHTAKAAARKAQLTQTSHAAVA